jgi:hypothetical protein
VLTAGGLTAVGLLERHEEVHRADLGEGVLVAEEPEVLRVAVLRRGLLGDDARRVAVGEELGEAKGGRKTSGVGSARERRERVMDAGWRARQVRRWSTRHTSIYTGARR